MATMRLKCTPTSTLRVVGMDGTPSECLNGTYMDGTLRHNKEVESTTTHSLRTHSRSVYPCGY